MALALFKEQKLRTLIYTTLRNKIEIIKEIIETTNE